MRLAVAAAVALAVARLLPESGIGLYLRLAAATAVALLPGVLLARTLRAPAASGTLAWSLTALAAALGVVFLVHASLTLALVLFLAVGLAALPFAQRAERLSGRGLVAALGLLYGIALWQIAGGIEGDALFHLGRVRKLAELDDLGLTAVGEFKDGGLHPGYAFPLWHGFLAVVATLAGVDPSLVVLHESSLLVPLALLVAYEAGVAVFGSAWLGAAVVVAQLATISFAPGGGGAYRVLELPATSSRQLLVPAAIALVFRAIDAPSRAALASVAAAALALAVVHPSYAAFLLVPLGGFLAVRAVLARREVREIATALVAFAVPTGIVLAAIYPIVSSTASFTPTAEVEASGRHGIERYAGQVDVVDGSFRLAPEVLGRTGSVAVAALLAIPLAALASRRRWASFVLGGSLAVLVLVLVPQLFSLFSDLVSLSQARRVAGFLPFAFAFAGGAAVLARLLGWLAVPAALAAGIVLHLAYPGDFGYQLDEGGPAWATWAAGLAGGAALVAAAFLRPSLSAERRTGVAALAAILFALPVALHAAGNWKAREPARPPLPDALVEGLPERAVVLSDVETSYRVAAQAPVYVVAAPPAHVADTDENRPFVRKRTVARFFRTGDLSIARQAGAGWILVDRRHFDLRLDLPVAFRDGRYTLYRSR